MKKRHMTVSLWISVIIIVVIFSLIRHTYARDLKASLAYLPGLIESPDKGEFVDLIKAIDEVYKDGRILIKVYPFVRSLKNVIQGRADFHLPMAKNPIPSQDDNQYRYASEKVGDAVIVIYSHRDNPVSREDIIQGKSMAAFPYTIETGRGMASYYDFPLIASSAIDHSMKKIRACRIDAFIWAQEEADFALKALKFDMIHRAFYSSFDDVIVIPQGPDGDEIDRILSQALRTLRSTGRLQELYEKIHQPYIEWQTYQQ